MSFITFLRHGPSHPSLYDIQPQGCADRLFTKSENDQRTFTQIYHSNDSLTFGTDSFSIKTSEGVQLVACSYVPFSSARRTWDNFILLSTWVRNGTAGLTLASVGALCWKRLSGHAMRTPLNLITGIATTIFAASALLAHYRRSEAISQSGRIPPITEIADGIAKFRQTLFKTAFSDKDSPFVNLPYYLHSQTSKFFTEDEKCYLLTYIFFTKSIKDRYETLYRALPTFEANDALTDQTELTNGSALFQPRLDYNQIEELRDQTEFKHAYAKFRAKLDFEQMQEECEDYYKDWVANNITFLLRDCLDSDTFNNADDKIMAQLFEDSYEEEMKDCWKPKDDQYLKAFGIVCGYVKDGLYVRTRRATEYLNEAAYTDFQKALYGPGFVQHFRKIVARMNESLVDEDAADWLKTQFTDLNARTGKELLLQSITLTDADD